MAAWSMLSAYPSAFPKTPKPLPEFKLIVAGGRDFTDYERVHAEIFSLAENELGDHAVSIVSGMARGADAMGTAVARNENIKLYEFPADWNQYGKRAGMIRNSNMAHFADGLLAFWDGKSRGTAHMIRYMRSLGKDVRVISY